MTTLRRERKQKFEDVLESFGVTPSPALGINTEERFYEWQTNFVNALLDAAESRTEKLTDEEKVDYITQANKKVDAILGITEWAGAKREARISAIQSYLGETFHRNTETKEWLKFAKFIDDKQQKSGEDVKVFVSWLFGQKSYDPQFWPVSKMMEFWPSAFVSVKNPQRPEGESSGYYA